MAMGSLKLDSLLVTNSTGKVGIGTITPRTGSDIHIASADNDNDCINH